MDTNQRILQELKEFLDTSDHELFIDEGLYAQKIAGEGDSFESIWMHEYKDGGDNSIIQEVRAGITKVVFFLKDVKDKVAKVPFLGVDLYEYDEDGDDKEFVGRTCFSEMDDMRGNGGDYCELEVDNYLKAQEFGVEEFFAKTECIGTLYGTITVYASERCVPYNDLEHECFISTWNNPFIKFGVPKLIAMDLEKQYSAESLSRLKTFLEDNDIYDLHSGNWGYGKDGKLKIIDYSNYYEDF